MQLSFFYAQLIGILLLLTSLVWIFRTREVETGIREIFASKGILALAGSFSLLFGLVIILTHNIWTSDWRGLVTLIGYLMVIRGVLRLGWPAVCQRSMAKALHHRGWTIAIVAIIGAYLTYYGMGCQ